MRTTSCLAPISEPSPQVTYTFSMGGPRAADDIHSLDVVEAWNVKIGLLQVQVLLLLVDEQQLKD